jgi:Dolichyl-phosphate-mannose-protein mannosyltransferase
MSQSPQSPRDDSARAPEIGRSARRPQRVAAVWGLVAVVLALGLLRAWALRDDPEVPLLLPEGGAQWVLFDMPFQLGIYRSTSWVVGFRKTIQVESAPSEALLTMYAFRDANVRIDGELIVEPRKDPARWKSPIVVDLAPHLTPGEHELLIKVHHVNGPPAMLAYSEALGLVSDDSWDATIDGGKHWSPARTADALRATEQRARARTGPQALSDIAPLLAVAGTGVLALSLWRDRRMRRAGSVDGIRWAAWIRWSVLGAWLLLIVHNVSRIPPNIGFDPAGHLAYIETIRSEHRLPLATDGWQMFQSPLYYLFAASWLSLGSRILDAPYLDGALRLLSLLCGMAQVEIVYRTLRSVLPGRQDLQALGVVLGGLLPMNLYMSHYLGNEPMAGALSAATVGLAMAAWHGGDGCRSPRRMLVLGGVLGLALLTKVTAVLLAPPLAIWLIALGWQRGEPAVRILRWIGCVFGAAAVVSGWYYVRNWIRLGKPFVGGWDVSNGIVWWQDPGYRTLGSVLSFGDSLIHPTAIHPMGFWDALYASFWCDGFLSSTVIFDAPPPWRMSFLIGGALLGLVPTGLMIAGAARALLDRRLAWRAAGLLALALVATYLAAMLDLYLRLPIYSTVKATYTLGLVPAYALLFVTGADLSIRSPLARGIVYALVACWALAAYLAYYAI